MRLSIRLFAVLRERAGASELVLEGLQEGLDVAALKRELARRHPELGSLEGVRGVLGDAYVDDATELSDGAEVSLLPPVSGGAPPAPDYARGVFEIQEAPLEPAEAQRRVAHPSCGANVLFVGTTRDTNRERDVERLDYEAFESMAGAEMARIHAECLARFGPESKGGDPALELRMLTLHRTGTVGVGEPSVVVAVASPHRDAAFAAARFLIDELKARVPLWKKEVYGDGHHWIGERS